MYKTNLKQMQIDEAQILHARGLQVGANLKQNSWLQYIRIGYLGLKGIT